MKFEIVEDGFSGSMAKIYSVLLLGSHYSEETLYDHFAEIYNIDYPHEVQDIDDALYTMGNYTSLKSNRIIPFEGENLGDGIVALCNRPGKILRVYTIMYGDYIAILGGGGLKPGSGALKKFPILDDSQQLIRRIKRILDLAENLGDITITSNGIESKTNFIYNSEDYE